MINIQGFATDGTVSRLNPYFAHYTAISVVLVSFNKDFLA